MRTRLLLIFSAAVMALTGAAATFMPSGLLEVAGASPAPPLLLIVQAAGALYLGFAMINWTARGALLGGIYGRPIALGNFLHFTMVAIPLLKVSLRGGQPTAIWVPTMATVVFAAWFGLALFTHPVRSGAHRAVP